MCVRVTSHCESLWARGVNTSVCLHQLGGRVQMGWLPKNLTCFPSTHNSAGPHRYWPMTLQGQQRKTEVQRTLQSRGNRYTPTPGQGAGPQATNGDPTPKSLQGPRPTQRRRGAKLTSPPCCKPHCGQPAAYSSAPLRDSRRTSERWPPDGLKRRVNGPGRVDLLYTVQGHEDAVTWAMSHL